MPNGFTLVSGTGTNSISVSINSSFASGIISVSASANCGTSALKSLSIAGCGARIANSVNETNDSIATEENGISFSLYPNPSNGNCSVEFNSSYEKQIMLEIYDITGKLIVSEKQTVAQGLTTLRINIGEYEEGIYMIRLTDLLSLQEVLNLLFYKNNFRKTSAKQM
ncbi:MAG: T9SS type A sorting domain-containing protein [Bacteroidia bacterium]|nr:T9SS type A sorting domain-containing protein [Bacteroidia bacterium]